MRSLVEADDDITTGTSGIHWQLIIMVEFLVCELKRFGVAKWGLVEGCAVVHYSVEKVWVLYLIL